MNEREFNDALRGVYQLLKSVRQARTADEVVGALAAHARATERLADLVAILHKRDIGGRVVDDEASPSGSWLASLTTSSRSAGSLAGWIVLALCVAVILLSWFAR